MKQNKRLEYVYLMHALHTHTLFASLCYTLYMRRERGPSVHCHVYIHTSNLSAGPYTARSSQTPFNF